MCVPIWICPLLVSKVGTFPIFSIFNPCANIKSSKSSPLLFVSGPYRLLCALLSIAMMTGYFFDSIMSMAALSHGWTIGLVISIYILMITVCLPSILANAIAQSLVHQLSMAVACTSFVITMPARGGG